MGANKKVLLVMENLAAGWGEGGELFRMCFRWGRRQGVDLEAKGHDRRTSETVEPRAGEEKSK